MTVREAVELHPGEVIYIGSASAFIEIGKAEDVLKRIPERENEVKAAAEFSLEQYKQRIEKCKEDIKRYEQIKSLLLPCDGHIGAKVMQMIEARQKEKEEKEVLAEKGRLLYEEYIREWIPVFEREAVAIYRRDVFNPGWVIIYDGYERGEYWNLEDVRFGNV